MRPRPTYSSILEVAFGWHALDVPTTLRSTLPPVVRITAAMLLRAIVDARLAVYEPARKASVGSDIARSKSTVMEEVECTPAALSEMTASGGYDWKLLAHYRLSMDELYVWAIGEGIEPHILCVPSWAHFEPPPTQPRDARRTAPARATE
jgi:hypothetical protein